MFNSRKRRAIKSLNVEINKAKRFGYNVGILLIEVDAEVPRGVHKDLPGITVNVEHIRHIKLISATAVKPKLRRYTVILQHWEMEDSISLVRDSLNFTSWIKEWGDVNIGIAIYPSQGQTSKELIRAAETDLKKINQTRFSKTG